jgi:hypothetical protein
MADIRYNWNPADLPGQVDDIIFSNHHPLSAKRNNPQKSNISNHLKRSLSLRIYTGIPPEI